MSGNTSTGMAAGWAGWAFTGMSSLTSKFVKSKSKPAQSSDKSAASGKKGWTKHYKTRTHYKIIIIIIKLLLLL